MRFFVQGFALTLPLQFAVVVQADLLAFLRQVDAKGVVKQGGELRLVKENAHLGIQRR